MKEACEHATITPRVSFRILRHNCASLAVMAVPALALCGLPGDASCLHSGPSRPTLASSTVPTGRRKA
jgi:hypothetical protein